MYHPCLYCAAHFSLDPFPLTTSRVCDTIPALENRPMYPGKSNSCFYGTERDRTHEIVYFRGYYASPDGRIWSWRSERWLSPRTRTRRAPYVNVRRVDGTTKIIAVAKLVLMAHTGLWYKKVGYRDGNPMNTALDNIYWEGHENENDTLDQGQNSICR